MLRCEWVRQCSTTNLIIYSYLAGVLAESLELLTCRVLKSNTVLSCLQINNPIAEQLLFKSATHSTEAGDMEKVWC